MKTVTTAPLITTKTNNATITKMAETAKTPSLPENVSHNDTRNASKDSRQSPVPASRATTLIGWILRAGVITSASLIALGLLLMPLHPGGLTDQRILNFPHSLAQEWQSLITFHPQAIIMLGLLLLIATPVLSVAASAVAFARERDRLFALIALAVLTILLASLVSQGGL
jgi:uncharacterized membrane protein